MSEKIGAIIKNERESKNLSLDEVAKRSQISKRFLIYLEQGCFEKIPGKFYVKKYLQAYLEALGINFTEFCQLYSAELEHFLAAEKNFLKIADRIKYEKFRSHRSWLKVLALILFLIMLVLLFFYIRDNADWRKFFVRSEQVFPQQKFAFFKPEKVQDFDFDPISGSLLFKDKCWLSLQVDGKKIAERNFSGGEKIFWRGFEVILTLGRPQAVELYLNNLKMEKLADIQQALKIEINPRNFALIRRNYGSK